MCTLAWGQQENRLWVCFNRDEQRIRPSAELPQVWDVNGNPCVYSRDPQGGGTWFAASGRGFVVALLNNYSAGDGKGCPGTSSRGELVIRLCEADSLESAAAIPGSISAEDYSPFFIFLLSPGRTLAWSWDGNSMKVVVPEHAYWTSSSFKPEEVQRYRCQKLSGILEKANGPEEVAEQLRQCDPQLPTHGLTMDRVRTRTVSQIELMMDACGIRLLYHPREPGGMGYSQSKEVTWSLSET